MQDYIEREAVVQSIMKAQELLESNIDKEWTKNKPCLKGLAWANRIILDTPAADVVEVVRCQDCKHGKSLDTTKPPFKYYKDSCVLCECEDVIGDEPMVYLPTHFCSYGERKEIDHV